MALFRLRKLMLVLVVAALVPVTTLAGGGGGKIFPYEYTTDDLPNGLRLITIPTEYPDLVSLYIVVRTGSRNEIEAGKSGYAHLFEHLMFRGSENFSPADREDILKKAGAASNAYTTDDRTVYHVDFAKEDFDTVMRLEADAFLRLKYDQSAYKTETQAVLGEYNKNSANPVSKLFEVLRENSFKEHTYGHTTMGYLRDIEDMPNQFDYSWQFYNRYYRPEYTTIVVVGDITRDRALASVRKEFGSWKRGDYSPTIKTEPVQDGPRSSHVEWPSQTLPWVAIGFRAPAYSDTAKDKVALDLMADIAFGENSELYRKLVITEQKADTLGVSYPDRMDSTLFIVLARVKNPADVDSIRDQILATIERFKKEPVAIKTLDQTRSRARYSFALSLDSSSAIASNLAQFIGLRRSPETIDRVFALAQSVTPDDIKAITSKYLVDSQRTIVTLASAPAGAPATKGGSK